MAPGQSVTHCNPCMCLGSILRISPATPSAKIQSALRLLRDETLSDLASRLGRSRVHLTEVANCTRESARLRQEIASDLGVDVDDIWTAHTESLPQALAAGQR